MHLRVDKFICRYKQLKYLNLSVWNIKIYFFFFVFSGCIIFYFLAPLLFITLNSFPLNSLLWFLILEMFIYICGKVIFFFLTWMTSSSSSSLLLSNMFSVQQLCFFRGWFIDSEFNIKNHDAAKIFVFSAELQVWNCSLKRRHIRHLTF